MNFSQHFDKLVFCLCLCLDDFECYNISGLFTLCLGNATVTTFPQNFKDIIFFVHYFFYIICHSIFISLQFYCFLFLLTLLIDWFRAQLNYFFFLFFYYFLLHVFLLQLFYDLIFLLSFLLNFSKISDFLTNVFCFYLINLWNCLIKILLFQIFV